MFSNSAYENDYLFYACLLSNCTVVFNESMEAPAGVSYNNCTYKLHINTIKFNGYTLEERLAILKHEMLHILNGHLLYRHEDTRNHKNVNIAMDCAINQLINSGHLPKDCILPRVLEKELNKKIKRLEPFEYYYDLLNNSIDKSENIESDSHESWELSDSEDTIETQKNITTELIEDAKNLTLRTIGTYPNEYSNWLKINKNETKINWKKYFKSLIKTNTHKKSIYKPNRRMPDRLDLKGSVKNRTSELLYIIDASGSVKNNEFKELNSVIINLCAQYNLKINTIQVDSEASEPEVLTKRTELIERKRNAGTFLSTGLIKAEERKLKFDTVIVSTDGYISSNDLNEFKKINKKIIFLICKNGSDTVFKDAGKNIFTIKME
jgi:predicted metal-dependent peptidase